MARYRGIHWGTGYGYTGVDGLGDPIVRYLDADAPTILNEPEAQWHYAAVAGSRPGLTVFRSSPATKPAHVGYNANTYAGIVFEGIDAHHSRTGVWPSHVLRGNEENLNYERGDDESDIDSSLWSARYQRLAAFDAALLPILKQEASRRGADIRWWYQGWAPGHGHRDYAYLWAPVASLFYGVVMHAYRDRDTITDEVEWYLSTFRQPILLGEWNTGDYTGDRLAEESRILARLDRICQSVERFSACYFIWRWAEDRSHQHDIEGNDARLALWDGRVVTPADDYRVPDSIADTPQTSPQPPETPPEDKPVSLPTKAELRPYGLAKARENGVPVDMADRQLQQESGWEHYNADGSLKTSRSNAVGVAQIIQRWHPAVDVTDPYASLDYWARLMRQYHDGYQSRGLGHPWKLALMAYNWGSGNVDKWLAAGADDTSIRQQTTHYLDVILGSGWTEPGEAPPQGADVGVVFEDKPDPEPAGTFYTQPLGVILHGSRSGKAGNAKLAEYNGTANWEVNNPDGLGWNATIGEGRVAVHLDAKHWGWNARAASGLFLAVEFAQATVDEAISDAQVDAFCAWMRRDVLPVWPALKLSFPTHAELDGTTAYGGYHDGKTDVFPKADARADALRTRILSNLTLTFPEPEAKPVNPYSVGPGILAAMTARGDAPAHDELYHKNADGSDAYSEAHGTSGRRYVYLPAMGRVYVTATPEAG